MRTTRALIGCVAVGILIMACSLPQLGVGPGKQSSSTGSSTGSAASAGSGTVTVTNDASRNIAIYTGPSGTTEDVSAVDPTSGQTVSCVSAAGFSVVDSSGEGDSLPVKVLVVGERSDGSPGAWEIHSDGKIDLVQEEGSGHDGDLSPERGEAPEGLHTHLGWVYHVTAVSADGRMIVGYAENPQGFTRGPISIPAGTTVGLYWRAFRAPFGRHVVVSAPRVIGAWGTQKRDADFRPHRAFPLPAFLAQLKLFFSQRLKSYLIMTSAVSYDSTQNAYVVTGTDQDGNAAEATISRDGVVAIAEVQAPATTYSDIVIETYNPTGPGPAGYNFDVIGLFSAAGVLSSQNPWTSPTAGALAVDGQTGQGSDPNAAQQYYAYIDYKPPTPLPSGTVLYVRINGYDATLADAVGTYASTGPYAIRVLTAPSSSYTYFSADNTSDSPYEPDNPPNYGAVPTAAPAITVNNVQGLNRYLSAGDVDWVKITLP